MQATERPARPAMTTVDRAFPVMCALLLIAVGFAIHLLFFPIGDIGVEADFYGDLVIAAERLWRGEFSVTNYPYKGPVYSFALVGVRLLAGLAGADWYRSGVVLNLLCAGAFVVLIYRLLRGLFPRAVTIGSTLGILLVYEFFMHSHKASSDLLFLLLFWAAAGLWLTRAGERPDRWRLIASGVLSGLALLTRYNGLVLPVTVAVVVFWINPGRWHWRVRSTAFGIYLAALSAVLVPWYAANLVETGRPFATRQLQNIFVQEFYAGGPDGVATGDKVMDLPAIVRHDPLHFLRRYLANIPAHLWLDVDTLLGRRLGLLTILGLLRLLVRPPDRRLTAFFVFPACYFLAMCLVYHQPRFSFPLLPAYLPLALTVLFGSLPARATRWGRRLDKALLAAPLGRVKRLLAAPRGPSAAPGRTTLGRYLAILVLAAVLVSQVQALVEGERYYYARRPLHVFEVADYLRERAPGEGWRVLMGRKGHLAHYAGMTYAPYPPDMSTRNSFLTDAFAKGVDVIAVSEIERRYYPGVLFLDRLDAVSGVRRVYDRASVQLYEFDRRRGLAEALSDSLLAVHRAALAVARAAADPPGIVEMGLATGADLIGAGEWAQALPPLQESLAAAQRLGERLSSEDDAIVRINVSFCLQYLGRHAEGIALLGEDLRGLRADTPPMLQALARSVLAGHHRALGHAPQTIAHLRAARDLYLQAGMAERAAAMTQEIRALGGT